MRTQMKNFLIVIAVLLAIAIAMPAMATPANLTNTTLSAAITTSAQTRVTVASATGITVSSGQVVNTLLVIDDEIMTVDTLAAGTTIFNVTRGFQGTTAFPHNSGAIVWAVSPSQLHGNILRGSCTSSTQATYPRVSVGTGFNGAKAIYYETCTGPLNAQIWTEMSTFGNTTPNLTQVCTIPVGSVAYASLGTSTAMVSGTEYVSSIFVPQTTKFTGVKVLQNGTVATDKVIGILRDAMGTILANSAVAGVITVGANTFLTLPFTATVVVPGPARYFIGAQGGTTATDGLRLQATATYVDTLATSATGTFGTVTATFTVPTTFTADKGPVACLY